MHSVLHVEHLHGVVVRLQPLEQAPVVLRQLSALFPACGDEDRAVVGREKTVGVRNNAAGQEERRKPPTELENNAAVVRVCGACALDEPEACSN